MCVLQVLCPYLRSRDFVAVGGVSREVRGVVRGGTKEWDLSFTRTTQQVRHTLHTLDTMLL